MIDEPAKVKAAITTPMIEISSPYARKARDMVSTIDGVQSVSIYGDRLHIAVRDREVVSVIMGVLRSQGIEIQGQREIAPSLEDVFISMVESGS